MSKNKTTTIEENEGVIQKETVYEITFRNEEEKKETEEAEKLLDELKALSKKIENFNSFASFVNICVSFKFNIGRI